MKTTQTNARYLRSNLVWVILMMLLMMIIFFSEVSAQKYNWKQVEVGLTDGRIISGELLAVRGDSLIMLDKNKMTVGSRVTISLKGSPWDISGKVLQMNDSIVVVKSGRDKQKIYNQQIKAVQVQSQSRVSDIKTTQTSLTVANIEYVGIRKTGSVGMGAAIGVLAGGAIGYAIGYNSYSHDPHSWIDFGPQLPAAGGGFLGALIGGALGSAVGSSRPKHIVHGDSRMFTLLAEDLVQGRNEGARKPNK
jgi:hypothetical protein